ncbi:hypothetical protein HD806DRAFT_546880 [Xylariaceae sp. AK1471]|nr:hypothetical protein HD806DRAFT_546880 [Xylariaceae sp. AK1471]
MSSSLSQQAVEAAWKRAASDHRSRLERLPNEVRLLIVNNLPDVLSIFNLALSGPEYCVVIEDEAKHAANKVSYVVGRALMPLVATLQGLEALRITLPGPIVDKDSQPQSQSIGPENDPFESHELRTAAVYDPGTFELEFTVLDRHLSYDNMRNYATPGQATKLPISIEYIGFYKTSEYVDLHKTVEYWGEKLASYALKRATSTFHIGACIKPTHTEMTRFYKALYALHLVSTVSPWQVHMANPQYCRAWNKIWEGFAPWEMEQVRCVQLLLNDYLREKLVTGQSNPWATRFRTLSSFILTRGLKRLRLFDTPGNEQAGREEFGVFCSQMTADVPFRIVAYPWNLELMELKILPETYGTVLDAEEAFKRYAEEECGPKVAWYHALVQYYPKEQIFQHASKRQFACEACMPLWGYVFWDYETLSTFGRQPLPSTNEMLKFGRDIAHHSESFEQARWDRAHRTSDPCDCTTNRGPDGSVQ